MITKSITALELVRTLQQRAPWEVASPILKLHGIKPARGWEKTLGKFQLGEIKIKRDDIPALEQSLHEHIECGEKNVRFYRLRQSARKTLATYLEAGVQNEDPLALIYPKMLDGASLQKAPLEWGRLISCRSDDDETVAVFSGVRAVEIRVIVEPSTLPKAVQQKFENFTEIYGIEERRIQTMDVVRVPKRRDEDLVEVRCDFPVGLSVESVGASAYTLHSLIAKVLGDGEDPVNLFPVIDPLFKARNEGDVVEAGFTTHSGSIKHERMRRSNTSLRNEPYHRAGRLAIADAFNVFKLAVRWPYDHDKEIQTYPEAFFSGSAKMLGKARPWLGDVSISGCLGASDFNHVRDKIISYIP